MVPRRFEQTKSPDNIRLNKSLGSKDRIIDMSFRRQIYDSVNRMIFKQLPDEVTIANVSLSEFECFMARCGSQMFHATSVSQQSRHVTYMPLLRAKSTR